MEIQVQLAPEHQGRVEVLAANMGIQKRLLLEDVVAMGIEEIRGRPPCGRDCCRSC